MLLGCLTSARARVWACLRWRSAVVQFVRARLNYLVVRTAVQFTYIARSCNDMSRAFLKVEPTAGIVSGVYSFLMGGELNGSEHAGGMIAALFKAHGVKFVFCLSGGHISPILIGSKKAGIKVVDVRHEVNAVFAADAVARVTGIPGVAIVTAGPGVTNTITAVKNAQMAESPLVLIGRSSPVMLKGRGALQDIDQRSVLEPIVKKCWTVTTVRDIVPALREAFQVAQSGTPGPVFVELPIDILYSYLFIASNAGMVTQKRKDQLTSDDMPRVIIPSEFNGQKLTTQAYLDSLWSDAPVYLSQEKARPDNGNAGVLGAVTSGRSSLSGWVTEKVLQAYLRWQFADGLTARDLSPLPVHFPVSPLEDVEKCATLLMNSQRPVLVLGSQATLCVDKVGALVDAIRHLGIPTFLGGSTRGLLGRDSPHHISQGRGGALRESDCVILCGAYADFRLQYGASLPSGGKIVSVNRDVDKLNLNSGIYWKPTLLSNGDPCHFLIELSQMVDTTGKFSGWLKTLKSKQRATDAKNATKGEDPAPGRWDLGHTNLINPIKLLKTVDGLLPDNAILVADGGDFVGTAANVLRPTGPLRWLDPGAYGTLGVGAGFALGVKLAVPSAEVWILWGDGACGYSIMEYDTFARHGVNVIGLVGNDACWGQIEREQTPWLGDPVSNVLKYSPYENIAASLGGKGYCLRSPEDDIGQVVRQAQADAAAGGAPVLINALLGRSNFREGSISV